MPRPDPPDEQVTARLAALDLAVGGRGPAGGGWVPDQPDLVPAAPAAVAAPVDRPAAVQPSLADRLPPWARDLTATSTPSALLTLAAVCAVCVAVTGYLLLHRPDATPPTEPVTSAALPLPTVTPSPTGIVVDVGGRVRRPGLVTLPPGARVADALRAAGGALRHRDVATVNLAARVADGQLIVVGMPGGPPVAGADPGATGGAPAPVNLNTATLEQLDELPGIGPVLAQRIIDWRTANGGFASVDDLNDVSGIGESTFADISPLVVV
jgi:competence protein ComEA